MKTLSWSMVAMLFAVSAGNLRAAVIYDFESYSVASLIGQGGWTGSSSTVDNSGTPPFGSQFAKVTSNGSASNTLAGGDFGDITTFSYRTAVITSGYAEVQLFDSSSPTPVNYGHFGFQDSIDRFYIYGSAGILLTNTPVTANDVYSVAVTLDFTLQKYRAVFTDSSLAVAYDSGFVNFKAATTTALAAGGKLTLFGGSSGNSGYFDDISVTAVPEPTAALLASLAALGFLVARRRKSSVS